MGKDETVIRTVAASNGTEYVFTAEEMKLTFFSLFNPSAWGLRRHKFIKYRARKKDKKIVLASVMFDLNDCIGYYSKVRKNYRKTGLGKALLLVAFADLKKRGITIIDGYAKTRKQADYYEKIGGKVVLTKQGFFGTLYKIHFELDKTITSKPLIITARGKK